MISLSLAPLASPTATDGVRPVYLQHDLAAIADLVEACFAQTMDEGGRAAIREMRAMSKMGRSLGWLLRFNELVAGLGLGFVYMQQGQLIGNVSVYPAHWPRSLGRAWIIANVAVYPHYQGRGIARQLMHHAMSMIAGKGGQAILQVDVDNPRAIHLYERLGFRHERGFTTWRRSSFTAAPPPFEAKQPFIAHRRSSEWQAEYQLAELVRPAARGGLGWLRPLHPEYFHKPWLQALADALLMNNPERMVARDSHERLLGSLWIENSLGLTTRLTLLAHPFHPEAAHALLVGSIRRFRTSSLLLEHPLDDEETNALLRQQRFMPERSVYHMRWQGAR